MARPRKKLSSSEPNLGKIRHEMRAGFDRVMEKLERDYRGGHESAPADCGAS